MTRRSRSSCRPTQHGRRAAIDAGFAVPGSLFTYAIGKLVLWSKVVDVTKGDEALKAGAFAKLSIANPGGAPYGIAAVETMKALGVYEALQAEDRAGRTALRRPSSSSTPGTPSSASSLLSQLVLQHDGTRWLVPQALYTPIRQDAVLLKKGENDEASKAFLDIPEGPGSPRHHRKIRLRARRERTCGSLRAYLAAGPPDARTRDAHDADPASSSRRRSPGGSRVRRHGGRRPSRQSSRCRSCCRRRCSASIS